MEKKSLHAVLSAYSQSGRLPMHMPGHKRNKAVAAHLCISAEQDYTELAATDNLHAATGILKESMDLAASVWGSLRTYYLVNGSSGGILAGIRTLTKRGETILVSRNVHRSVFHAIELCGLVPVFILPRQLDAYGICASCTAAQVEEAFSAHPDIRLVVLTSPTYEGVLSNIAAISRVAHAHNVPVFVDEAHGAHLDLHPNFPGGAVKAGADLVVQSLHKTLPAFTQTAVLHVCSEKIDTDRLQHQLDVFETSSPSYPLMLSADGCVRQILNNRHVFDAWIAGLELFRRRISALCHLRVLGYDGEALPESVFALDASKLYISTTDASLTGAQLAHMLSERKIDVEAVYPDAVLALTGTGDSEETLGAFSDALLSVDAACGGARSRRTPPLAFTIPDMYLMPEQALEAPYTVVDLQDSIGKVSAEYAWAYPPGIPLLLPGERICEAFLVAAEQLAQSGVAVYKSRSGQSGRIAVFAA